MSIARVFGSARRAIADWHNRERAYAELMSLDDRSLADIGIRRPEIAALVHGVHGSTRSAGFSVRSRVGRSPERKAA